MPAKRLKSTPRMSLLPLSLYVLPFGSPTSALASRDETRGFHPIVDDWGLKSSTFARQTP
jgi:hypothetical protein